MKTILYSVILVMLSSVATFSEGLKPKIQSGVAGVTLIWPGTGGFWSNGQACCHAKNAEVLRMKDRAFVGAAADYNGRFPAPNDDPKIWLERAHVYTQQNAQMTVMSTTGLLAFLAASRTSDHPVAHTEATIGGNFWVLNDNSRYLQRAYAQYSEARRYAHTGGAIVNEQDITNFGNAAALSPYSPYHPNSTINLWLASGGGPAAKNRQPVPPWNGSTGTATTASLALGIVANGANYEKGVLFGRDALAGNDGRSGYATAIAMPKGDAIEWWHDAGKTGAKAASIHSDVTSPVHASRLHFTNAGFDVEDITGEATWLRVAGTAGATEGLQVIAGASGRSPMLGPVGRGNLGIEFTVKNRGRLVFNGPVTMTQHVVASGDTPQLSNCGSWPAIAGSDTGGEITVGSSSAGGCVINFAVAYDRPPFCTVSSQSGVPIAYALSRFEITIKAGAKPQSAINYVCIGR
jgi:hypothetical protein